MEEKKAYQKTMEEKLADLGAKIDKLQGKAEKAGGDAKAELNQQIKNLKEKRDVAKKKMAELNSSKGEAWKSLKSGMQSAWDELSSAVDKATSKLDKKKK